MITKTQSTGLFIAHIYKNGQSPNYRLIYTTAETTEQLTENIHDQYGDGLDDWDGENFDNNQFAISWWPESCGNHSESFVYKVSHDYSKNKECVVIQIPSFNEVSDFIDDVKSDNHDEDADYILKIIRDALCHRYGLYIKHVYLSLNQADFVLGYITAKIESMGYLVK